jgi:hypothetical protein
MYRVTKMGHNIYAKEFSSLRLHSLRDDIEGLLEAGDHVLLVNELEDAADVFGVEVNEIVVVEDE